MIPFRTLRQIVAYRLRKREQKTFTLVDRLATVALVMILTFQMWHTSGLYLTYSRLTDDKSVFAAYFLAFTIEFMVFIFVWKGKEKAGAWFSICLFFVGILFNDNWTGSEFYVMESFPYFHLYLPKNFVSSTLLQFMSSLSIWYLTEIHVENREKQTLNTNIQALNTQKQDLISSIAQLQQTLTELEKTSTGILEQIARFNREKAGRENALTQLQQSKEKLEQEVNSLRKAKAGLSTRKTQEIS